MFEQTFVSLEDALYCLDQEVYFGQMNDDVLLDAGVRYVNSQWQVYVSWKDENEETSLPEDTGE